MSLLPTTLRSQLLLGLLGFILVAEVAVAAAVLHTTYAQTMSQARTNLRVGERVLDQLMSIRGQNLLSTVDVLTSDFGFKSAVATRDAPTLRTVLANFGDRVGADLAMLASPAGELIAAVPPITDDSDRLAFSSLLNQARQNGGAAGLTIVGNHAYQLTLVPVNAPRRIAWVGMGFQVDAELAQQLASLVGLNVEFIVIQQQHELFRTGTLGLSAKEDNLLENDMLIADRHVLSEADGAHLDVVLALKRSEVLTAYHILARNLTLVFILTLLVSALVAFWLARKISQPVRELSVFAESVAAGAYSPAPHTQSIGELKVLAHALDDMQNAVRQRENRIRHQAVHDPLTGLPNRTFIRETAQQYFDDPRHFAAIRIAIHDFSRINTAIGYQLGDQVLKTVAERLRAAFDERYPLGRIEGNDFLLLMSCDTDEATLARDLTGIRRQIEMPIDLANTRIALTLEIGVLMVPRFASDLETLWRRTVIARDGSRADKGRTFFYEAGLDERRMRELTIIQGLAPALKRNELHLVYQPKMTLTDGTVHQVEALARWIHPELGFIPPDEFIGLAERSGQIKLLTHWLIGQLTRQLRQWREAGTNLGVALNLSADELADGQLPHLIAPLLKAASPIQRITLEVTESALLRDPTAAMANLARLQSLGARIAVDDFGSGYSSLAQLKQLSADELKIDKSLVLKLDTTPADQSIVQMIIDLGHRLGLEVVAEGVENAASWRYLVDTGADLMQGYLLARPMAADVLDSWIREHANNTAQWRSVTQPLREHKTS